MWKSTHIRYNSNDIYRHTENGLWLWKSISDSKWKISTNLFERIDIDGNEYIPQLDIGFDWYDVIYRWGNVYNWKDSTYWIISSGAVGSVSLGESYWRKSGASREGTYSGVGGASGTSKTLSYKTVVGWESSSFYGEYNAIGGETGEKYVGWKRVQGDNGLGYLIQNVQEANSEYIFIGDKNIWFDGADWVISDKVNVKDPLIGYWKSSTVLGAYNLVYTGEPPNPSPSTYTITFVDYVEGESFIDNIVGEIGIFFQ